MSCPVAKRCELLQLVRFEASTQALRAQYCDTASGHEACARYKLSLSGKTPTPDLLPSGKRLSLFERRSGVHSNPAAPTANVFARDDGYIIAIVGPILITYWISQISISGMRRADEAASQILAHTHRYAVLNLVEDFVPLPTLGMQQEAAALMKKTAGSVACSITVLRGEGLWVRAARPLLAAIGKLALTPYPVSACAGVEEAGRFIQEHLPTLRIQPADLAAVVAEICAPESLAIASRAG